MNFCPKQHQVWLGSLCSYQNIWIVHEHNITILFLFSPEPYTVREARIHVRHIRDLLKSLDPSDAYNGVDCNSLSFLSIFTDGDLGGMTVCEIFRVDEQPVSCTAMFNRLEPAFCILMCGVMHECSDMQVDCRLSPCLFLCDRRKW